VIDREKRELLPGGSDEDSPVRADRVYISAQAGGWFLNHVAFTAAGLFLIIDVGVNPLQLVLVGTVIEATAFLCEVPTGVVADVAGRKVSVVIGHVLLGCGFLLYAMPQLWIVLAGQVLLGIGFTFVSGAFVAWVTDEIGAAAARPLYLRTAQARQVASILGLVAAGLIGLVALWLPVVLGGLGYLALAGWLASRMVETRTADHPGSGHDHHDHRSITAVLRSARRTIRGRPVIVVILAVTALHAAAGEGFMRLWELLVLTELDPPGFVVAEPIVWFAGLRIVASLLAIGATELVRRRADLDTDTGASMAVAATIVGMAAATVGFALTSSFAMAAALFCVVYALELTFMPVVEAWVNTGLDPRSRATVNSVASQSDALGQMIGGPVLGWIALARSVRTALAVAGVIEASGLVLVAARARLTGARWRGVRGAEAPAGAPRPPIDPASPVDRL
jgi:DHA3 family tetracycline resistance protein-like MFS transporter